MFHVHEVKERQGNDLEVGRGEEIGRRDREKREKRDCAGREVFLQCVVCGADAGGDFYIDDDDGKS